MTAISGPDFDVRRQTLYASAASRTTPRARPWQLNDAVWLTIQYAEYGDRAIAKQLDCQPLTVTRARQRLGIESHRYGRRRGTRPA